MRIAHTHNRQSSDTETEAAFDSPAVIDMLVNA